MNQPWLEKNGLTSVEWEITSAHLLVSLCCWRFSILVIYKGQQSLYSLNFQMYPPCTYLPLNSISTNPFLLSVCPSLSNQLRAFSVLEGK